MSNGAGNRRAHLPYLPGVDGLRALSVSAVVLYHAGISWLPAGFLGVDVFFVISGYLITTLLVGEWDASGKVDLRRFWLRRARRLLPALYAVLVGVTVAALALAPDAVARLRGDLVAALFYGSNWWQVIARQSYFEVLGRPPLFRHLWSLAVEEQFYVLFPPVLILVLRRGRSRSALAAGALVAAGVSTILMAALWSPTADPSRVYFGSDTRAAALLVGVALAVLRPPIVVRRLHHPRSASSLAILGGVGLAGLALLMVRADEVSPFLYRGGFALTALLSGAALLGAVHPRSVVTRALSWRPLVWAGTRSYAIYLWHWPVMMLTRPNLDIALSGWRLLAIQLIATALLAEASWRLIEQPIRTGSVRAAWAHLQLAPRAAVGAVAAIVVIDLVAGLATTTAPKQWWIEAAGAKTPTAAAASPATTPIAMERKFATEEELAAAAAAAAAGAPSLAIASTAPPVRRPRPAPASTAAPAPAAPPTTAAPTRLADGAILAVGESVMLAAQNALLADGEGRVTVDARVGRQNAEALDVLARYRDSGELAHVSALVVHIGTNGPLTTAQFDRLAEIVKDVPRVVVVNVRVPKRWEAESNHTIETGVPHHEAMRMADWYQASGERGVVGNDGVHPTPSGARVYSHLVLGATGGAPTTTTTAPPETTTTTEPPPTTEAPSTTAPPPTESTTTTTAPGVVPPPSTP